MFGPLLLVQDGDLLQAHSRKKHLGGESTVPEIVPVAGRVGVIRRKGFAENKSR